MVEIHYHLLHAVDDGPKDIEASLLLAEASIAEGVTHIVSTPHANSQFSFDPEVNCGRLAMIQERLGNRISLALGCDFHLSEENLQEFEKTPSKYTINGGKYLLVELSDFGIPRSITGALRAMVASGTVPIVTHPERNALLSNDFDRLAEWLRIGCLIQITAGSLSGRFGPDAMSVSHRLLKKDWVHLVASDAHGTKSRPPAMATAYEVLKKRYGQERAGRLCTHNPLAVFHGDPLPERPEPVGVRSDRALPSRSLFSRIFQS